MFGFGLASKDTGQLYTKRFYFLGSFFPSPHSPRTKVLCSCVHFVLMTENQSAQRAVMSLCGGAARWSDVAENLLKLREIGETNADSIFSKILLAAQTQALTFDI
jgi:hypothetical protein